LGNRRRNDGAIPGLRHGNGTSCCGGLQGVPRRLAAGILPAAFLPQHRRNNAACRAAPAGNIASRLRHVLNLAFSRGTEEGLEPWPVAAAALPEYRGLYFFAARRCVPCCNSRLPFFSRGLTRAHLRTLCEGAHTCLRAALSCLICRLPAAGEGGLGGRHCNSGDADRRTSSGGASLLDGWRHRYLPSSLRF